MGEWEDEWVEWMDESIPVDCPRGCPVDVSYQMSSARSDPADSIPADQ